MRIRALDLGRRVGVLVRGPQHHRDPPAVVGPGRRRPHHAGLVIEEARARLLVGFQELGLVDTVGQPERSCLDHRHERARRVATTSAGFPPGFFDRVDEGDDAAFYAPPRLVTHIDDGAIGAVGELYDELRVTGDVLDLMSSWVSHFRAKPRRLVVLGMNAAELEANPMADQRIVHDLNADPLIPLPDGSVDDAVCCVSVDYLTAPIDVFRDVARVLRPNGRFVVTFSNRLFPTKAIRGWLYSSDDDHCRIVAEYFAETRVFAPATVSRRTPPHHRGDPLFAVWATRL